MESNEYFTPKKLDNGVDVHQLEVRAEAPPKAIRMVAEKILEEANALGDLTGSQGIMAGLRHFVDIECGFPIFDSWRSEEFLKWPPTTWEPHYATKGLLEHYVHGTTKQICLGPLDLNHLVESLNACEASSSSHVPTLPPAALERMFMLVVNQLVPLNFKVWQHANRGMEERSRREKHTGEIYEIGEQSQVRDILRAQSTEAVHGHFAADVGM